MTSTTIEINSNGKRDGEWKYWYDNGELWYQQFYKDGKRDGEWKGWHENGKLWHHRIYKDGEKDGEWKEWYDNGKLWYHQFYKDGEMDGEWKLWYDNGELWYHKFYKDGEDVLKQVIFLQTRLSYLWRRYYAKKLEQLLTEWVNETLGVGDGGIALLITDYIV